MNSSNATLDDLKGFASDLPALLRLKCRDNRSGLYAYGNKHSHSGCRRTAAGRRDSDEIVGGLLASLSMAVPFGGRILEIGTGAGVGCAWIVS
jgi:hypothetical protein